MEIKKTVIGDSMVIALQGRLETTTAPELETVIKSLRKSLILPDLPNC